MNCLSCIILPYTGRYKGVKGKHKGKRRPPPSPARAFPLATHILLNQRHDIGVQAHALTFGVGLYFVLNCLGCPWAFNFTSGLTILVGLYKDFISLFASFECSLRGPIQTVCGGCTATGVGWDSETLRKDLLAFKHVCLRDAL